jgi:hypothetical protein
MMEDNDIPCVSVPLLVFKPWLRKNAKGEDQKYEDHKWKVIELDERG